MLGFLRKLVLSQAAAISFLSGIATLAPSIITYLKPDSLLAESLIETIGSDSFFRDRTRLLVVAAAVVICTFGIETLRALLAKALARAKRSTEFGARTTVVSDAYFYENGKRSVIGIALLAICISYGVFSNNWIFVLIASISAFAVALYAWLTWLRCIKGWFADNPVEVLELVNFITSKEGTNGLPPGTKATRNFEASKTETDSIRAPGGALAT